MVALTPFFEHYFPFGAGIHATTLGEARMDAIMCLWEAMLELSVLSGSLFATETGGRWVWIPFIFLHSGCHWRLLCNSLQLVRIQKYALGKDGSSDSKAGVRAGCSQIA